jgi:CRP/FNR family transcriptional regulator, nitrogen fixation regulation protein
MERYSATGDRRLPGLYVDDLTDVRSSGTVSFGRDESIYGEGDPAVCFYKVTSGAVRSYKVLRDGRRQIAAFYLTGDVFGVEPGLEHRLSAEAIRPTRAVAYLHRGSETGLFGENDRLSQDVVSSTVSDLCRSHNHAILLGRKSSLEKVATFLLDIAGRMNSDTFDLPMSRLDIADYLGLTIETVSRTMAKLARDCVITMQNGRRTVVLRNKPALCRLREADQFQ